VAHLKAGKYMLRIHEVGYRHDDAYTIYQKWGRPAHLTARQLGILRRSTTNKPVIKKIVTVAASGDWTYSVPMRTNRVMLLQLSPAAN
jgi:beta-xylosidase